MANMQMAPDCGWSRMKQSAANGCCGLPFTAGDVRWVSALSLRSHSAVPADLPKKLVPRSGLALTRLRIENAAAVRSGNQNGEPMNIDEIILSGLERANRRDWSLGKIEGRLTVEGATCKVVEVLEEQLPIPVTASDGGEKLLAGILGCQNFFNSIFPTIDQVDLVIKKSVND